MAHQEALRRIKSLLLELRLAIDELENDEPEPPPAGASGNIVPFRQTDEVELTGKVGRPAFTTPRGIPLWSAGLGVANGVGQIEWINVQAWRGVAEAAQDIGRGQLVTLTGRFKEESFVGNDGLYRTKRTLIVSHIA